MDMLNPSSPPGFAGEAPASKQTHGSLEKPLFHLLGTDTMGRDIASRLIFGARISLSVGLLAPAMGLFLGGTLGIIAGFYRGRLGSTIMTVMDTIFAFPGLVLILAVAYCLGVTLTNLVTALGLLVAPAFSRIARANTMAYAAQDFVLAARSLGASDARILCREMLPNIAAPLIAFGLMLVAVMIVVEGALGYLGLGVPPPTPSWGGMIAEGREVLDEAPHVSMIPSLVMFMTVLSFNLIGDGLKRLRGIGRYRP
jgi:peptide/nickel transport system permease protein